MAMIIIKKSYSHSGQALAKRAIGYARQLTWKRVAVEIRWVPGHEGLEGTKRRIRRLRKRLARSSRARTM